MFRPLNAPILALAIAVSTSACFGGHRIEQALAPGFPDLRLVDMVEIRDAKNQVLVSGKFAVKSESSGEIVRVARLTNPANDDWEGEAEIRIKRDGNNLATEDAIRLKVEDLPDDTPCIVMFDTLKVADFMTNGDGEAEIHLERDSLARRYD